MIQLNKLDKYFNRGKKNELHVLKNIDLELPSTGFVCILGESGSGKTTLLNTIGGLDTFQGGTIAFDDLQMNKYEPKKVEALRSEKLGYIFQSYYLLQDYSVAYNVKLALSKYDLTEEEKDARVDYVLKQLGISRFKKKLVSKLSGGQQQRVSIARALVKSPQIILADEPTGNLDEENTIRTMSILKSISKSCLVVLVSHERRIAEFFADRIIEIRDGELVKDWENANEEGYVRGDDGNIYLPELSKVSLEQEDIAINVYQEADTTEEPIKLQMAWKNGKLYIRSDMQSDVIFAGEEAGCEISDDPRPELDLEEVEQFDYHLEKLPTKKSANLPGKEIWRIAMENIRMMGKKQIFVVVIMLITSVLLTLMAADFYTTVSVNPEDIVADDSHYIEVAIKRAGSFAESDFRRQKQDFFDKVVAIGDRKEKVFCDSANAASIKYRDLYQMSGLNANFNNFSFVDIKNIDEKDLIAGRLPQNKDEVVLDAALAQRFMRSDSPLAVMFHSEKDFVGQTLRIENSQKETLIVGISNIGEMSIFCKQNLILGLASTGYDIASVEELQQAYPDKYQNISLKDNEVMMNQSEYEREKSYSDFQGSGEMFTNLGNGISYDNYYDDFSEETTQENDTVFYITGSFPDDFSAKYVLNDNGCFQMVRDTAVSSGKCKIYIKNKEDREAAVKEIQKAAKSYVEYLKVSVTIPYEAQIQQYKDARREAVGTKKLFVLLVVIVSMLMIYFTIKSNATARMEELTVYRLIGIGRRSVLKSYLIEMILINAYTTLPAVAITSIVLHFISGIPSMGVDMTFPWWCAVLLVALVCLVSGVISMLPVHRILSKPPAELAVKE